MENKLETVSSAVDTAVAVNERGGVGMFVKGEPVEEKHGRGVGVGGQGAELRFPWLGRCSWWSQVLSGRRQRRTRMRLLGFSRGARSGLRERGSTFSSGFMSISAVLTAGSTRLALPAFPYFVQL